MKAKAPLDVDLEDKLLYGLTPTRLAYIVLAMLGGFALWSSPWAPSPVRGFSTALVVGVGAAAAWGRWRGRPFDAWFGDLSLFLINTHRLVWNKQWRLRPSERSIARQGPRHSSSALDIVVTGRAPKVGATTVAAELAACLAANQSPPKIWSVRTASVGSDEKPHAASQFLSVSNVAGWRVCYLDRGSGTFVVAVIPDDDHVRKAAALGQATVVAFPDAPASRALKELAEVIIAGDR